MKISGQVEEIMKFIDNKLKKGIICATKTVDGKKVELIYTDPLGGFYIVKKNGKENIFYIPEEACEYYDSIN